jgi:hypothetical protein
MMVAPLSNRWTCRFGQVHYQTICAVLGKGILPGLAEGCSSALAFQTRQRPMNEFPTRSRHSIVDSWILGHPISRSTTSPIEKSRSVLLTFALCSHRVNLCVNGCHARFVFNLCPRVAPTHAAVVVGIGLEWNRIASSKFVQPGCTVTTNRIQVGEMLLQDCVEACKKEGPKFMQRLVAKQKTRVKD